MLRLVAAVTIVFAVSGCGEQMKQAADPPRPEAAAPARTPDSAPAKAAVAIKGFTYSPARVTVRMGGKVTWTDEDASNHTVTFAKPGPEDIGNLREGRRATVAFEERGSFAYVCEFHPGMAGTVEVR